MTYTSKEYPSPGMAWGLGLLASYEQAHAGPGPGKPAQHGNRPLEHN